MSSVTPNLNLVLPVGEENVSRQVINDNMGKIDTAYGNLQGGVMRKVPFSVTVGDWVLDDGVYVAEFATEYVTASSSEFAFYTSSYSQYAVSDIVMDKKPGGGALVFTTTDLPTGTIAGTLYVFDNNDGKIPVIMEDTVLPIANGGTGENTLAGAKNALGIEQLESDVADINAHLAKQTGTAEVPSGVTVSNINVEKINKIVWFHFVGSKSQWAEGDTICTLPSGYRPSVTVHTFATNYNMPSDNVQIGIGTDGKVVIWNKGVQPQGNIYIDVTYFVD